MSRRSLRASIDAMCKSCIYDPDSGNGAWREQVEGCSSSDCPLHAVRPMSKKAPKSGREERKETSAVIGASAREIAVLSAKSARNGPANANPGPNL